MTSPARAVYTVLLGGYERLNEQPAAARSRVPFICLTDDPGLVSATWRIVPVTPAFAGDMVRSQRELKLRGHVALAPFAETLYIDNSIRLRELPEHILDAWLADHDLAVPLHPDRDRLVDEFDVVAESRLDDPARVHEQLLHYAEHHPDVLKEHPFAAGMIARRHTPAVAAAMERWWWHVLRYARRDQLSANLAFAQAGIAVNRVALGDIRSSALTEWPIESDRRSDRREVRRSSAPALIELARVRRDAGHRIADLESRLAAAEQQLARERRAAEELRRRVDAFSDVHATLTTSTSWRMTAPMRAIGTAVRRRRARDASDGTAPPG